MDTVTAPAAQVGAPVERTEPAQEAIEPVDAALTRTAEPVAAPVGRATEPVTGTVEHTAQPVDRTVEPVRQTVGAVTQSAESVAEPVGQTTESVLGSVDEKAEPLVGVVEDTAEPVVNTVLQKAEPAIQPVRESGEPLVDAAEQTIRPVEDAVDPIVRPALDSLKESVAPVTKPVKDTVDPVLDVVENTVDPVVAPVVDPVVDLVEGVPDRVLDPIVGPITQTGDPVVDTVTNPVVDRVPDTSAPVVPLERFDLGAVPAKQPLNVFGQSPEPLRAPTEVPLRPNLEVSPLEVSIATASDEPAVLRPAADVAPSSPRAPPSGVLTSGGLSGIPSSYSSLVARHVSGEYLFTAGEFSSLLERFALAATAARGTYDGDGKAPQLPFSGTTHVPLSSASSSAFGASVGGSGTGSLVLLLGLFALLARLLLSSREFLRPNSVYGLIVNQPG